MEEIKHSDASQFKELSSSSKFSSQDLITKSQTADDLICSICLQFSNKPVECTKCRCHFCEDCVNQWKEKQSQCPNRCENAQYGKAHPYFFKSLSSLNLKCKNKQCRQQFILEQAQNHQKICQFQEIECMLCKKKLLRKDIGDHLKQCKLGDCEKCGIKGIPLQQHDCVKELLGMLNKAQAQNKAYRELVEQLKNKVHTLEEQMKNQKPQQQEKKPVQSIHDATIYCRNKHRMGMMKKTPYFLSHAHCDGCGARKISKYYSYFFHCGNCRYDLCPNCVKQKMQ